MPLRTTTTAYTIFSFLFSFINLAAQEKLALTDSVLITKTKLSGSEIFRNNRKIVATKAIEILEFETGFNTIIKTEILEKHHQAGDSAAAGKWLASVIKDLKADGWIIKIRNDSSFYRVRKHKDEMIMHITTSKDKSELSFGEIYNAPSYIDIPENIIGSWGNQSPGNLNPNSNIFSNETTAPRLQSLVNYGIEFKLNGTYQATENLMHDVGQATCYKTGGTWSLEGDHITLVMQQSNKISGPGSFNTSVDRTPHLYLVYFRVNENSGRLCLFLFENKGKKEMGYCKL